MVALRALVVSVHVVQSGSMAPTVGAGDLVVVDRLSRHWAPIGRGDLVVFSRPGGRLLKRVVAVARDRVSIRDGYLVVNGERVAEPYVDHSRIDALYTEVTVVPPGHVFVLGDRRDRSVDSRTFGPVPLADVEGRAVLVL